MSSTFVSDQVSSCQSTNESTGDSISSPTNYTLTEHEIARIRNKYLPSCRDFENGEMGNYEKFNIKVSDQSLLDGSRTSSFNKPKELSKIALTHKNSKLKSNSITKSNSNDFKVQEKPEKKRNKSISFLSNQLYKDILSKKEEAFNIFNEVNQDEMLKYLKKQRKSLISQHSLLVTATNSKDDKNKDKTIELQNELDQVIEVLHKIIQELLVDRDSTLEKLKIAKELQSKAERPQDSLNKKYKTIKYVICKSWKTVCSLSIWKSIRDAVVSKTNQYLNKNSSSNNEPEPGSNKYKSEFKNSSPYAEIGSFHSVYTREHKFDNNFGESLPSNIHKGETSKYSSTTVDTCPKNSLHNLLAMHKKGGRFQLDKRREQSKMHK